MTEKGTYFHITMKVKIKPLKNIIKRFQNNYDRKILIDELSRILKHDKTTEKGQVNNTQVLEKIYRYKK